MRSEVRRIWKLYAALFSLVLAFLVWSFLVEPNRLVVHRVTVPLIARQSGGPLTPLMPLTVAVLGDLHVGSPFIDRAKLRTIVDTTNALAPDLVVLLGDFVIQDVLLGKFVPPEVAAEELARLRAPRGVFAILGNHDWWLDGPRIRTALVSAHITVLENESAPIQPHTWVAGVADLWTRKPDLEATLRAIPDGDAILLLTHSPDLFPDVPSRVALTLAAHTHGGQVALPFLGRLIVPSRYGQRFAAGLIEERGRKMFVTSGIGTSILPIRFRVPPEIALLTLTFR
ncbi:MAG: metallophosphoesterase [Thermoanaerobaculia bacterium]